MTSLVGGADRSSIVTEVIVAPDGAVKSTDIYPAMLHNYAKLSYESVGAWLDNTGPIPPELASVPKMDAQIRLQFEAAQHLRELRKEHGALELQTIEAAPVVNSMGQVTELSLVERNSARDLIENFMIAANVAMARFLTAQGALSLRRVVRTPEHWDRIVEIAHELDEQLPAQADSRALADFLAGRQTADREDFPDLSLSLIQHPGLG